MTTKDKGDQKELQKYLSAWQKRHQEYLEKKSQEKASETDEEDELSSDARVRTVSISNDCFSSGDGSFILVGTRSIACVLSCVNSTVLIHFRRFTKLYS